MTQQHNYKSGDKVVYPSHGVGEVKGIETQNVAGAALTTYVVYFDSEKMTLRIPVSRVGTTGLRSVCSSTDLKSVRKTLKGRARVGRGMWSRRAREYESKINSGNILYLAEVVRDLHRNVDDPDRSYSERIIYENALERLAGEVAAVENVDRVRAEELLVKTINDNLPKEEREPQKVVKIKDDFDDFDEEEAAEENMEEAAA